MIYLFNICSLGLKIAGHKNILGHQTYVPPEFEAVILIF